MRASIKLLVIGCLLSIGIVFAELPAGETVCQLPHFPVEERINNRDFPSVFAAWGGRNFSQIRNLKELSHLERLALHDLKWHGPYFDLYHSEIDKKWMLVGDIEEALVLRDAHLALNPNMIFIVEIRTKDAWVSPTEDTGLSYYPEDFPYWLRNADGDLISASPISPDKFLIDFTQPGMQDIIVQQVIAIANCGLYDGVFFDWWNGRGAVLTNHEIDWDPEGYVGFEAEQQALDNMLRRIRAAIRDDFLIIINTGRTRVFRRAWGINGTFMETLADNGNEYTRERIIEIEDTLRWSEANLRQPQINCLEGRSVLKASPDDPNNLRWMRVFTTMSLTISDGYVLYGVEKTHEHYWHSFWNADLGRPVGVKSQAYENIEGLFIREFTNGWAVYNRSGSEQKIVLPGLGDAASARPDAGISKVHRLPDLDGEIYLKIVVDLNADGMINVLDLIIVSQNFGTTKGDVNGDGTTNILDLTLVAAQFK